MPRLGAYMSTPGSYDQAFYRGQQVDYEAIQAFVKELNRCTVKR